MNPYCNDNPDKPESCADQKREILEPPKDPCFDEPAKFDRILPVCVAQAIAGGQPRNLIQPLVDNVFSFEVENDANVPFTFEWWIGCPGAAIRELDPSEVEFIINEATKTTISFRPSHLEATGVAVVVDDTPGNVIKTTTGLFAIAKSRCGDLMSDCIDTLDKLPHEIQDLATSFGILSQLQSIREHVTAFSIAFSEGHFVQEVVTAFSYIPGGPHLVGEHAGAYGFIGSHPDQDTSVFPS